MPATVHVPGPLQPPIQVMLARNSPVLPAEDALPGGVSYEAKVDGWRLLLFSQGRAAPAILQTRAGRLITHQFPEIADAGTALVAGTVLDGELVMWSSGRLDFDALHRRGENPRRVAALAASQPASYVVFDLLALRGKDTRALTYRDRRERLLRVLEPLGPPIQPIDATTSRERAAEFIDALLAVGVEGAVCKGLDTRYVGNRRGWLKHRAAVPIDAAVLGTLGPARRPRALLLQLPGEDRPVVSAPLTDEMRVLVGRIAAALPSPGGPARSFRPLPVGLTVEVMRGLTERHARVVVMRLRTDLI